MNVREDLSQRDNKLSLLDLHNRAFVPSEHDRLPLGVGGKALTTYEHEGKPLN